MDKNPFFSVIIPTHNYADKLRRALDSIYRQSFGDFEVIVCDDGSIDHTKQVIDEFSDKFKLKYLWEQNWGGPARPRNNGLKVANGEYIAFLDADDWWYPNKLEVAKRHLRDCDILYHDLDVYTPKGKKIFKKVKGRHLKNPVFVDLMKNENCLITSSVIVKKDIIRLAGGFPEGFLTCVEDFDLWLNISRITEKFTYIPKSLGAYWIEGGNVSEASEKIIERLKFVYNKYSIFLNDDGKKQSEMILNYLLGRINQKIGFFDEALKSFKISVNSNNKKIRFRSMLWIVFLRFFYKYLSKNKKNSKKSI